MAVEFTPVILVHTGTAFAALALGTLIFPRRKGDLAHRGIGGVWATLMVATAVSSFWIKSQGGFSWIHGLSVLALALLALGVGLAMAGNRNGHRKTMQGLFFGALVISGLFTLMPHRLFGRMLLQAVDLA